LSTEACEIVELSWPANVTDAVRAHGNQSELAWLDSSSEGMDSASGAAGRSRQSARFSLVCADPLALIEQHAGRPARFHDTRTNRVLAEDRDGWRLWARIHRSLPRMQATAWPLGPGWVGYLGFELANQLEVLPERHVPELPLLRMGLFDQAVVLDAWERRAHHVAAPGIAATLGLARDDPDFKATIERWERAVSRGSGQTGRGGPSVTEPAGSRRRPGDPVAEMSRADYERMIRRALEYIAAGDIYQVNLAQRLRITPIGDSFSAYAAMRRANPAPYGAFLRWAGGAIASVSPELFLRLRDREALTRPIKGTRPRTRDPATDRRNCAALLSSAKDAAELAMIVDLHRNDLGRVCEFGSMRVVNPRMLEAHPTVFHTVAEVAGRLAPGRDAIDLLRACFPPGSISGVPKIRALQIIDELEPVARGAYTGAIGALGLDGQMTFNVAIRTLQIRGDVGWLHVGGGIVAESEPAEEYAETLAKGRGILSALAGPGYS
jgi:para-aminobenzoate synthetase component 1